MSHKIFFVFVFGFAAGIALRSFYDFGWSFILLLFAIAVVVFFSNPPSYPRVTLGIGVAVFLFAAGLGMLRFDIADLHKGSPGLNAGIDNYITVKGIIIDEPDEREFNTRIVVQPYFFGNQEPKSEVLYPRKSRILVMAEQYPQREYGDILLVEGLLQKPKNFTSDTGRKFNYVDFLGKDGIYYQMYSPKIELIEKDGGNIIKRNLFALKRSFLENISRVIPEPHSSLLGGLVVGAKQSMGEDLLDAFRATGIIHIVVLSGYNITIVAEAIGRVFSFAPLMWRLILGGGSILGFMIMVGAGATVVRASIMAILILLARAIGRMREITIALVLAGFFMLLFNPKILIFDPSFQLSFLATVGLIYLAPLIEKYFHLIPTRWQLREFATATIATQIFVLPLLLYMTGQLSLVSVPVNLLILIFVPLTMLFGFLAGSIGFFSTLAALPFAFVSYWLLAYELKVVDLFASLPFSDVFIPRISVLAMVLVYVLYSFVLWKMYRRTTNNQQSITKKNEKY